MKAKLADQRDIAPLFDTERFTRNLESAFTTMWERTQRGAPAESFAVAAAASVSGRDLGEAWRLHRAGEHEKAEQLYREIIRADPSNYEAHHRLAFLHGQRSRWEDAQRVMARAIELNPGAADALFLRGAALQKLQSSRGGGRLFRSRARAQPGHRRGTAEPGRIALSPAPL